MPEISEKSFQKLKLYLKDHSQDIADGENDFGILQEVYKELCDKNRKKVTNISLQGN